MDLLPASSLLSPQSRVLIHTETQFHLTEPIFFLPVLIYGPDHDLRELKGGGSKGVRGGGGRLWGPKGRGESGGGSSSGALIHCLLTGPSRAALIIMGKAQ